MQDEQDDKEFERAMRDVTPHVPADRVRLSRARPAPVARQRLADEAAVLQEMMEGPDADSFETGETLSYRAPGVQERVLRQLRRGHFRRDAELDLHGLNRTRARAAVGEFLALCQQNDFRCVRIIHGKGKGSPNSGPVLKRELDGWLRRVRAVVAFCSARPADGGSGAIYVLLRSR